MADESTRPEDRPEKASATRRKTKVLLVDDEERFRLNLAQRLALRGYETQAVESGEHAIREVRLNRPDVVILDRMMPGMGGEQALREIKLIAPEVQVIILTGHSSIESAKTSGRLDAFAYLGKPCETEDLIATIEAARRQRISVMALQQIPYLESRSTWAWIWGDHGSRPGIILLGVLTFLALAWMPTPSTLRETLRTQKNQLSKGRIAGYSGFADMMSGETIGEHVRRTTRSELTIAQAERSAKVMIGLLVMVCLFWATGALPLGITSLTVGLTMYLFSVYPPDLIAKAHVKDPVIFVVGVMALAAGIRKTGLDRRIGLGLLRLGGSIPTFLFLLCPLLAVLSSFVAPQGLIGVLMPMVIMVYMAGVRSARIELDRGLAVLLILSTCFAINLGGLGSPVGSGGNALMIGILADYGSAPSFGQWVGAALPFVLVVSLSTALYFILRFRRSLRGTRLRVQELVREESEKLGRPSQQEIISGLVLMLVIVLWLTASKRLGLSGPALLGLVALSVFRVIRWRDINQISWDIVALYASACALAQGLATTGASAWMASSALELLPDCFRGEGFWLAASLLSGIMTNFIHDGAVVSTVGPVAVSMATAAGTHPWMVGFCVAFAASFGNCLIIGSPNNAIAYFLAKDVDTGEQLITPADFLRHGLVVSVISLAVLWVFAGCGLWQWIGS